MLSLESACLKANSTDVIIETPRMTILMPTRYLQILSMSKIAFNLVVYGGTASKTLTTYSKPNLFCMSRSQQKVGLTLCIKESIVLTLVSSQS